LHSATTDGAGADDHGKSSFAPASASHWRHARSAPPSVTVMCSRLHVRPLLVLPSLFQSRRSHSPRAGAGTARGVAGLLLPRAARPRLELPGARSSIGSWPTCCAIAWVGNAFKTDAGRYVTERPRVRRGGKNVERSMRHDRRGRRPVGRRAPPPTRMPHHHDVLRRTPVRSFIISALPPRNAARAIS
jgi:hypothetical protein